jgi:glycosyltransferase involved in cell wall biosynthesis
MTISVLICTYGDPAWKQAGARAALDVPPGFHEVIHLHEPDATLAEVRNLAAVAATGDWLCFVDADDRLDSAYLEEMEEVIATGFDTPEDAGWDGAPPLLVPAVSFVSGNRCTEPTIPAWSRLIYDVNCAVIGTLVHRRLFARVGGFHEWEAYEDWELWLRCIAAGAKLVPVPSAVYCARAEDGTGRNTYADHRREYELIRARHMAVPFDVWARAKT